MILVRFPPLTHFKTRAIEWGLGAILLNIGVVLLDPYPTFSQPALFEMARIASEQVWGWSCISIGLARLIALWINGAWRKSPYIRATTAILSSLVWIQIVLGLLNQPIVTFGMVVFIYFVLADWYSVWRAMDDADNYRKERSRVSDSQA